MLFYCQKRKQKIKKDKNNMKNKQNTYYTRHGEAKRGSVSEVNSSSEKLYEFLKFNQNYYVFATRIAYANIRIFSNFN